MSVHLPASVRQRLLNLAKKERLPYNRLQLLYLQERWLARLSETPYKNHLVLKGALFLYSRYGTASRPTRDIDFLGRATPAEVAHLVDITREIARVDLDDAVAFDPDSVVGAEHQAATEYGGVHLEVKGYLGRARELIRMDVGFGDAVIPAPVELAYPTLLGHEPPKILAYSFETVVAEKVQAMTVLYEVNSRFKDFYDVYHLALTEPFEAPVLREALLRTFERRRTPIGDTLRLFSLSFTRDAERQRQWQVFLDRVQTGEEPTFEDVLGLIQAFLEPVIRETAGGVWHPLEQTWMT